MNMNDYDDNVKPLEMEAVPGYIWNSVYEKWRQAYIDGWEYWELWHGCDLCKFVVDNEYMCIECPLYKDSWCKSYGSVSRISIQYDIPLRDEGDEDNWRARIREFLIFLKPYCTEDYNE